MSFDFALENRCPHEVVFESASSDLVNGYVYFQRQPANQASISLFIDGVNIPQSGLYSSIELPIMKSEPYKISAGVNDLLYIGIGNEIPRFIQLLTGTNLKAVDLAADLQRKIPNLSITARNKRVIFRLRSQFNASNFRFPDPRWSDKTSSSPLTTRVISAFSHLGIIPGRVIVSKRIIPGWSLVQDSNSPIVTDKCIRLNTPISNVQPLLQTSYTTIAQNCRRCFGSRIEFDYAVTNGTYDTVTQTDLLNQEFDKFLFTKLGSHWRWSWLGSRLIDFIGGKSNGTRSAVPAIINMDVSQAYKVYENIKHQQEQRYPFQRVSDAEMPSSLDAISVQTLPDDPTVAIVSISIRSRSRTVIPLSRVIGNPSPFYLTDNNNGPPLLPRG